jgi:hypothetical protein
MNNCKSILFGLILSFLGIIGCGGGGGSLGITPTPFVSIKGTVAKGQAVANEKVYLLDQNQNEISSTITSFDGRYSFKAPETAPPYIIKSLSLISLVATKPETKDKVVNLNDIVTFSSSIILSDPTRNITDTEIKRSGDEVVGKVLGEGVKFDDFLQSDFVAKTTGSNQQPSLHDVILDGINETAETDTKSPQDLLQERFYSSDKCIVPLLEDENFTVSFAGNLLEAGYKSNALITTIKPIYNSSEGKQMVTSLTIALEDFVTKLEKEQNKVVKVPMKALRATICKVMDKYLARYGKCRMKDLGPDALNKLFDNVLTVMKDAIIKVAEDVEKDVTDTTIANTIIENTITQTASVVSQIELTDTLNQTVLDKVSDTVNKVTSDTAKVFLDELKNNPNHTITSLVNSVDTTTIATTTLKLTEELVSLPELSNCTSGIKPKLDDFKPQINTEDEKPTLDAPISKVKEVKRNVQTPSKGILTGEIELTAPEQDKNITNFKIYWGNKGRIRINKNNPIGEVAYPSETTLKHLFSGGCKIPEGATCLLIFSCNKDVEFPYPYALNLFADQKPHRVFSYRKWQASNGISNGNIWIKTSLRINNKLIVK